MMIPGSGPLVILSLAGLVWAYVYVRNDPPAYRLFVLAAGVTFVVGTVSVLSDGPFYPWFALGVVLGICADRVRPASRRASPLSLLLEKQGILKPPNSGSQH